MRSGSALLTYLIAAALTVAAVAASPASASMLDVDGGRLHHWVEPGPGTVAPPLTESSEGARPQGETNSSDPATPAERKPPEGSGTGDQGQPRSPSTGPAAPSQEPPAAGPDDGAPEQQSVPGDVAATETPEQG